MSEENNKKEYNFKLKKGDIEIELISTDEEFIKDQCDNWRKQMLKK